MSHISVWSIAVSPRHCTCEYPPQDSVDLNNFNFKVDFPSWRPTWESNLRILSNNNSIVNNAIINIGNNNNSIGDNDNSIVNNDINNNSNVTLPLTLLPSLTSPCPSLLTNVPTWLFVLKRMPHNAWWTVCIHCVEPMSVDYSLMALFGINNPNPNPSLVVEFIAFDVNHPRLVVIEHAVQQGEWLGLGLGFELGFSLV